MTVAEIVLYKGSPPHYYGRLAMEPLLKDWLRGELDGDVDNIRLILRFLPVDDAGPVDGTPNLVNLLTTYGELEVLGMDGRRLVYRARHTVRALFGPRLLQLVLRIDPDEPDWSFRVSHPVLDQESSVRPVPEIEGTVDVNLNQERRLPFTVDKIDEPETTEIDPNSLGMSDDQLTSINVLLSERLHQLFLTDLPLSARIEEGGFLLGKVRRATSSKLRHLVELTHVTPAERTGAGATHFTFTGDSFSAVNRLIAERGSDEELVGWYHTHPFQGTASMGLSAVDLKLHFGTFRRPWQVAGLINITSDERLLRFYGRVADEMRVCAQWTSDDRGGYRFTGTRVVNGRPHDVSS